MRKFLKNEIRKSLNEIFESLENDNKLFAAFLMGKLEIYLESIFEENEEDDDRPIGTTLTFEEFLEKIQEDMKRQKKEE